jgi:hypothetical protein
MAFMFYRISLSINNLMSRIFPVSVWVLLKIKFLAFYAFEVILYFITGVS